MFQPHPSTRLQALFRERPYQGARPEKARYLFVGLDANYAERVEASSIFPDLLEYHEDGVGFWRRAGVHHPFLLPAYSGDGRFYHRSFARIGFGPEHAHLVSFVELLPAPTVGRSKLTRDDLDARHLERLRSWMFDGPPKHVFVTSDVLRLTQPTRLFPWQTAPGPTTEGALHVVARSNGTTVHQHLHFSNYGKFHARKLAEAEAIRALLARGCSAE